MSTTPDSAQAATYRWANCAFLFTTSVSLLLTTLFASPESKSATIQQMVQSVILLLFAVYNMPAFFPTSWLHWSSLIAFHTVYFVMGYTSIVGSDDESAKSWWRVIGSGALWMWGVGLLVFAGEGRRARSSYLFTPEERRRQKVERREQKFGKFEKKIG